MKRKRKASRTHGAVKRQKTANVSNDPPTWPLLRQYYPNVLTLRQYLSSKLSKKRRKKVLQYDHIASSTSITDANVSLGHLLDRTAVGTFNHTEISDTGCIDNDITIFTQQVSGSSAPITPTQGALQQCEVGSGYKLFHLSLVLSLFLNSERLAY